MSLGHYSQLYYMILWQLPIFEREKVELHAGLTYNLVYFVYVTAYKISGHATYITHVNVIHSCVLPRAGSWELLGRWFLQG